MTPEEVAICESGLRSIVNAYARLVAKDADGRVINSGSAVFLEVDGVKIIGTAHHVAEGLFNEGIVHVQLFRGWALGAAGVPTPPIEVALDESTRLPLPKGREFDIAALTPPHELTVSQLPRWFAAERHVQAMQIIREEVSRNQGPALAGMMVGFPRFLRVEDGGIRVQAAGTMAIWAILRRITNPPAFLDQVPQVELELDLPSMSSLPNDAPALIQSFVQRLESLRADDGAIGGYSGGPVMYFCEKGPFLVGITKEASLRLGERGFATPIDAFVEQTRRALQRSVSRGTSAEKESQHQRSGMTKEMGDSTGVSDGLQNGKSSARAHSSDRLLPVLVAHADWSCNPRKRWMAIARRQGGRYEVGQPEPVGELGSLFKRLEAQAGESPFVLGVDFPIGLPIAYARAAGITRFVDVLPFLGTSSWSQFYDIASTPADIALHRPFYPRSTTGGSSRDHLVSGLRLSSWDELYRECERRQEGRNAACPVFWTLGGQQVGRGTIVGWRDLLAPALVSMSEAIGLWPFHGNLQRLLNERRWIVAETYPAEACCQLRLPPPGRGWSKRNLLDRKRRGEQVLSWVSDYGIALSCVLKAAIRAGFCSDVGEEDGFDAALGVLSMLGVLLGKRTEGVPDTPTVRDVEGWIFGQLPGG